MAREKAGNERQQLAEESRIAYEEALQTACARLSPANVEQLRLECCRCVLYNEIFNMKQRARDCAIAAGQSAIIDGQPTESFQYNSLTIILDLLIKFSEDIDEICKGVDEMRTVPIIRSRQEGGRERKRRKIN